MPRPIKRGNSWQAKVRRKLPNGRVTNVTQTFDTYKECETFIEGITGRLAKNERVDTKREQQTSFAMLLDRYERDVVDKLSDKPASQRRSLVRKWRRVDWVDYPIVNLEAALIVEWRDEQVEAGYAGSTVAGAMNTLSGMFRLAATEWGYRILNPVTGVSRPKPNAPREAFLRPREEAILFAACEQGPPQLPWAAMIALATAMRASEIRRLERRHIHLDNGFVHLPKTKNGDKRDVPLVLTGAADVMAAAMQTLPVRTDGYLFGHPDKLGEDGGYTQSMLTASFADAVDRAALADEEFRNLNADFRFHDARHVATTRLAPLHRDALDLAKTTGHKTLSVLMRYYNEKPEDRAARLRQVARDIRELGDLRAKRDRRARAKPKLKIV